jgi:hypothetical protein
MFTILIIRYRRAKSILKLVPQYYQSLQLFGSGRGLLPIETPGPKICKISKEKCNKNRHAKEKK